MVVNDDFPSTDFLSGHCTRHNHRGRDEDPRFGQYQPVMLDEHDVTKSRFRPHPASRQNHSAATPGITYRMFINGQLCKIHRPRAEEEGDIDQYPAVAYHCKVG